MRDELGVFYQDKDFSELFPSHGQPALSPWRLAQVTINQFTEGLTDHQAAEAVRGRLEWKCFDFSILLGAQHHLLTCRRPGAPFRY